MVSDAGSQSDLAKRWNSPNFWSPAMGWRLGVAILVSPRQRENISVWQKDARGHLLSLLITFENVRINLINIYALTYPTERKIFFQLLGPFVFPNSHLVITSDFNSYDSALDKMGSALIGAHFSELKSVNVLRDAWRLKHPRDTQFTWYNSDLSIASRLDSFLISRLLCEQVISYEIRLCMYSDRDFVFLELNLYAASCWGPGVWKFNNSLLKEEKFFSSVSDLIEHFLRFQSSFSSDLVLWDQLKLEIKMFTINYSRERWRHLSWEKIAATNCFNSLKTSLGGWLPVS